MALDDQSKELELDQEFDNDRIADLIYAHYDEWGTMIITPRRQGPSEQELDQL